MAARTYKEWWAKNSYKYFWAECVAETIWNAAIKSLEGVQTQPTNNASPKLPNPPCMVCTNGDKYAGNHGNYCQWCGRQLRAIA